MRINPCKLLNRHLWLHCQNVGGSPTKEKMANEAVLGWRKNVFASSVGPAQNPFDEVVDFASKAEKS